MRTCELNEGLFGRGASQPCSYTTSLLVLLLSLLMKHASQKVPLWHLPTALALSPHTCAEFPLCSTCSRQRQPPFDPSSAMVTTRSQLKNKAATSPESSKPAAKQPRSKQAPAPEEAKPAVATAEAAAAEQQRRREQLPLGVKDRNADMGGRLSKGRCPGKPDSHPIASLPTSPTGGAAPGADFSLPATAEQEQQQPVAAVAPEPAVPAARHPAPAAPTGPVPGGQREQQASAAAAPPPPPPLSVSYRRRAGQGRAAPPLLPAPPHWRHCALARRPAPLAARRPPAQAASGAACGL